MKLPNAQKVVIEERKIRDYLLSDSHPIGRFKASFFGRLGFRQSNWDEFRDALLPLALEGDAEEQASTEHGRKFLISGTISGPSGQAKVVSVWLVSVGDDVPRLVTVYPR